MKLFNVFCMLVEFSQDLDNTVMSLAPDLVPNKNIK